MDQLRTGKFIAEMRKSLELTQKDLAEKLNVSDKLISKWETGRGLPDVSVMGDLCGILHINVNELLSGEQLAPEEYHKKAEENMMELAKTSEKEKKKRIISNIGCFIGFLLLAFMIFFVIVSASGISGIMMFVDLPTLIGILGIVTAMLIVTGQLKDFWGGVRIAFGKKVYEEKEIRLGIHAVKIFMVDIALAAAIMFSIGTITISYHFDPESRAAIGPAFAVNLISCIYAFVGVLLAAGVWARLKKKQIEPKE